jgi:N-acetyl-gamma-glutamyl-phosphate reductase
MIADYENASAPNYINNPRPYALALNHKHLPEMTQIVGLSRPPVFAPTVVNVYNGEIITIPLVAERLARPCTAADISRLLAEYYAGEKFVRVMPYPPDDRLKDGFMTFSDCNGTNSIDIFVCGNEDRILLASRFDNLGKGASGAAVQNMNLVLGLPEDTGLPANAVSP